MSSSGTAAEKCSSLADTVQRWGSFVKFSHSVFALPFALGMAAYLSRFAPLAPESSGLILVAVVAARTMAMAFNRIVDRSIDARNPRTAARELPSGAITLGSAWLLCAGAAGIFFLSAALLNTLCLLLSPVVIAVVSGYSLTKRFTQFSHVVLGLALALAPGGVWVALTGEISLLPIPYMLGVLLWVAGFDMLYACQDAEFDVCEGLFSIPARYGVARAMLIARLVHCGAVLALLWFGIAARCGTWYFAGLGVFALLVASQHRLVRPNDLSRMDAAFFTRNGWASVLFFLGMVLDRLL